MNKDIVTIATSVRAAQSIKGLDPLDKADLDAVIAAVASLPPYAVEQGTQPHRTRKGQRVARHGRLVVSLTQKGESVHVKHVKVLTGLTPVEA